MNLDALNLLALLTARGASTSFELQTLIGKSQATVSRLLADLASQITVLGDARSTRYGVAKSIHSLASQQPLWWVDEAGAVSRVGDVSFLANNQLYIKLDEQRQLLQGAMPWFLTPLRVQGFLGRLLAHRLAAQGLPGNPERWPLESILFAATQLHDAPGAMLLGEPAPAESAPVLPLDEAGLHSELNALAQDITQLRRVGSSAGGEQPKFLAQLATGQHVLVKFTPPRGTPFGERWHDLLHAEALAADVLREHGFPAARCSALRSARRSYLVSERFDRVGMSGRRHVVSVGAAHEGLIGGPYTHWAASCEALSKRRWMDEHEAAQTRQLLAFGRLIGNTDMHSGNLSLFVERADLGRRRFTGGFKLAPVYDMLPMRWRPNPELGDAADYSPFEPDAGSLATAARTPALAFWSRLADWQQVSPALREVAADMSRRMGM